jgi:ribosomal protein S18 acetylase RimI-like enzyme
MPRVDVEFRSGRVADGNLIRATWLRAFKSSARGVPAPWYYAAQGALVNALLERSDVTIAHYPGDEDQVVGYCVVDDGLLHWVYTKGTFRRLGIATQLLDHAHPSTPRQLTHWTRLAADAADGLSLVDATGDLRL